jgi:hypothetical protein
MDTGACGANKALQLTPPQQAAIAVASGVGLGSPHEPVSAVQLKAISVGRREMLRGLAVSAVLIFSTGVAAAEGENLGEWLAKNEPRVVAYLESLSADDIGHSLPGVELSDGKRELEGYIYKGQVLTTRPHTHAYRFDLTRGDSHYEIHYIWIDAGGTCPNRC